VAASFIYIHKQLIREEDPQITSLQQIIAVARSVPSASKPTVSSLCRFELDHLSQYYMEFRSSMKI